MNRNTFFIIVGIILFIMAAFFAIQLHALAEKECVIGVDYDCMLDMEIVCFMIGASHNGWNLTTSHCEGLCCCAHYDVYCDTGLLIRTMHMNCQDEGYGCGNW